MNEEKIKIEPINNGFKTIVEIPKKILDLELNDYINRVDEINRLVINDKNELYIRELLNRIDKAIQDIETFKDDIKKFQEQDIINHQNISIGLVGIRLNTFLKDLKGSDNNERQD